AGQRRGDLARCPEGMIMPTTGIARTMSKKKLRDARLANLLQAARDYEDRPTEPGASSAHPRRFSARRGPGRALSVRRRARSAREPLPQPLAPAPEADPLVPRGRPLDGHRVLPRLPVLRLAGGERGRRGRLAPPVAERPRPLRATPASPTMVDWDDSDPGAVGVGGGGGPGGV